VIDETKLSPPMKRGKNSPKKARFRGQKGPYPTKVKRCITEVLFALTGGFATDIMVLNWIRQMCQPVG
jgi:hypothetical protein